MSTFPELPDKARLWIYTAADPLSEAEQSEVLDRLEGFMDSWTSHNRPVQARAAIQDDRFVILAATVADGDVSGCGIDASVHAVDEVASDLGIAWASPLDVLYRDVEGLVHSVSRADFRQHVSDNRVDTSTPVFDPSITTLGALRDGEFEQPAGAAWHARVFQIPTAA
ncbi:hypothetical protein [Longibacter sp.]|jgi:hypothetical protein|uniref:hypothetical protein n=1 Tax=Longibacter sp. TaxID=2045415 RepID=UPI003EBCF713